MWGCNEDDADCCFTVFKMPMGPWNIQINLKTGKVGSMTTTTTKSDDAWSYRRIE